MRSKKAFRSYYKKIEAEGVVGPSSRPPPSSHGLGSINPRHSNYLLDTFANYLMIK